MATLELPPVCKVVKVLDEHLFCQFQIVDHESGITELKVSNHLLVFCFMIHLLQHPGKVELSGEHLLGHRTSKWKRGLILRDAVCLECPELPCHVEVGRRDQ